MEIQFGRDDIDDSVSPTFTISSFETKHLILFSIFFLYITLEK